MSNVFMKFQPFQGPSRYTFKDPDTQYEYNAQNQSELVKQILGYRTQNRLDPIESLNEVLENYWCHLPENRGKCSFFKLKRGFLQTLKGGIALLTNYMYDKFVTQEIADARAKICSTCPHNLNGEKGSIRAWLDEIAIASVGDRRSSSHDQLGTCGICQCPLSCKVFYGGKIELDESEVIQMPANCWQRQEFLANR